MRPPLLACVAALLIVVLATPAAAIVVPGDVAPDFTKNQLDSPSFGQVTPRTLADYAGKVIVFFLLGYGCPFCDAAAESVEADIVDYYEANFPGQVQVVGVDLWDGTAVELRGFRDVNGITFPLLLNGSSATGGNFSTLYGTYDNFVVVNKQGIVRYHAALGWSHGNRYHLNEIRGTVDSLVSSVVGADPEPAPAAFRLASAPNPARGATTIELAVPAGEASSATVTVHDVSGRRVAMLLGGAVQAGVTRFAWSHVDDSGTPLGPGVYLVSARIGDRHLVHRAIVLP